MTVRRSTSWFDKSKQKFRLSDGFAALCESQWFCFALILLICSGVIILPIAIGGLHGSGDLSVYLSFAQEFRDGIASGDLLPGWANDNMGYGSVGIRFYPPIAPYLSAMIFLLINNWYYSIWVYFLLWMVVGSWGTYLFVREWGTTVQAVSAGTLYAITPFYIAEIYQYSLYAEFAAGAVVPFCFLFVTRICWRRKWIDVIWFSAAFAALVLTHIPATIITAISLAVYVPLLIDRRALSTTTTQLLSSVLIALLASSFYWIKVVTELPWLTHFDNKYSTGMAGFEQWLFPNWLGSHTAPDYYLPIFKNFDAIIVLTMFLLVPSAVLLATKYKQMEIEQKRLVLACSLAAIVGFFMLSRPSSFIWYKLELLQKIQFPWRWLTVISFLGIVSFVFSTQYLVSALPRLRAIVTFCVVLLVSLMVAYDARQSFMRRNTISQEKLNEVLEQQDSPAGTSYEAWWPIWARVGAMATKESVIAGDRKVSISEWDRERHFEVGEGSSREARVALFYYPHWKATINGKAVVVGKDENGAIVIPLDTERSEVRIYWEETFLNLVALCVSIGAWLFILLIILASRRYMLEFDSRNTNIG